MGFFKSFFSLPPGAPKWLPNKVVGEKGAIAKHIVPGRHGIKSDRTIYTNKHVYASDDDQWKVRCLISVYRDKEEIGSVEGKVLFRSEEKSKYWSQRKPRRDIDVLLDLYLTHGEIRKIRYQPPDVPEVIRAIDKKALENAEAATISHFGDVRGLIDFLDKNRQYSGKDYSNAFLVEATLDGDLN